MAIFLTGESRVMIQGITGSEGSKHGRRMLAAGTTVVGGTNPRKAGQTIDLGGTPLPVFGTVAETMAATGADVSVIFVPPAGTMERYRMQEMLGYINSELHKTYSPLFNDATPQETRNERLAYLKKRYALLDERLAKQPYLFGDRLTVADAYLFVVTRWANFVKLDLSGFPNVLAFQERVAARPAVKAAMKAEGLMQ